MREIKFRAYFKKQNKVSEPFMLELMTNALQTEMISGNVELLQFTGLFDKNGVEIYEGDIVEFIIPMPYGQVAEKGVMEFNPKYAQFGVDKEILMNLPPNIAINTLPLVIGNIYENSELLK
jgi:uncharacterized phage protein (TIGR01671 family)